MQLCVCGVLCQKTCCSMHKSPIACLRVAQVFKYGDLCQMTYDNYIRDGDALAAVKAGLSNEQERMRSAFQTGCPLLGGFKYLPSELMELPATNLPAVVKQVRHR